MSEFLNNSELRVKSLLAFSRGIMNDENGLELIKKHQNAIDNITPFDMLKLEDTQLNMGYKINDIKKYIDKVINVFYKSLASYKWEKPQEDTFLYYLIEENKALKLKLEEIKKIIIKKDLQKNRIELLEIFNDLLSFEGHYLKKENILFPYLENKIEKNKALSVMWSLDDDVKKMTKKIVTMLANPQIDVQEFNVEIGKYFFLINGLVQKEELVLFPVASQVINEEEWEEMHHQSFEYDFPLINRPKVRAKKIFNKEKDLVNEGKYVLKSETGQLTLEQALLVFNNLPLDITYVDENNKVRFFSNPKDRFFPRSPAIIGRDVNKCHPPESVSIVEEIVENFKSGKKDNAKFWLTIKDKFIMISYYALRDEKGEYKGVLEVSQDVSEIRSLQGQKRLLDWEK